MLCKCGCGEKTGIAKQTSRIRGRIAGLPYNYLIGHNRKKPIEDYVMEEPNSGCFLWIGRLDRYGYGKKWHLGKSRSAYRLFYESENGKIPDGMTVDHLCRTRSCVNVKHLEVVTMRENTLRGLRFRRSGAILAKAREVEEAKGDK